MYFDAAVWTLPDRADAGASLSPCLFDKAHPHLSFPSSTEHVRSHPPPPPPPPPLQVVAAGVGCTHPAGLPGQARQPHSSSSRRCGGRSAAPPCGGEG